MLRITFWPAPFRLSVRPSARFGRDILTQETAPLAASALPWTSARFHGLIGSRLWEVVCLSASCTHYGRMGRTVKRQQNQNESLPRRHTTTYCGKYFFVATAGAFCRGFLRKGPRHDDGAVNTCGRFTSPLRTGLKPTVNGATRHHVTTIANAFQQAFQGPPVSKSLTVAASSLSRTR